MHVPDADPLPPLTRPDTSPAAASPRALPTDCPAPDLFTGTETSISGFTSFVGLAFVVSVDPVESADAIAPSPSVIVSVELLSTWMLPNS